MERKEKVGLIVVGFLGIISAVLGISAEATRIKESEVSSTATECIYPNKNPASGLALTASIALFIARIIIIILTGCSCCKRLPNRIIPNSTALACLVFSWFSFAMAQLIFLGGAIIDGQRGNQPAYYYCSVVKRGQFAIASSLSLASIILGIAYAYALLSARKNNINSTPNVVAPNNQMGIAMGHPRPPVAPQDPVFVHEDTYMRRQFT